MPPIAVSGLGFGENLVGVNVRPLTGQLYGVTHTGTGVRLYRIDPVSGQARPLTGSAQQFSPTVEFAGTIGGTAFGVDFNPVTDQIRVVSNAGLNFRIDPNTGLLLDGDDGTGVPVPGVNPDGPIDGPTRSVSAAAHTNSVAFASATTLYTLDDTTNRLHIQGPPNSGIQSFGLPIRLNGVPLNFSAATGLEIPGSVRVSANNAPAEGFGYSVMRVNNVSSLYRIDLATGAATELGRIGNGTNAVRGLALWEARQGTPAYALADNGMSLFRFATGEPTTGTSIPISNVTAGETLVGLAFRHATGQLLALGINPTANDGTLYRLDARSGVATRIGTESGLVRFENTDGSRIDLPEVSVGYGISFDPTADRLRVVTGSGLNFRINPVTGFPVDGNFGSAQLVLGINPDAPIANMAGLSGAAHTNSGPGATATRLYTLDPGQNRLAVQLPADSGLQLDPLPVTVGGTPIDFEPLLGFDIPSWVRVNQAGELESGVGYAALTVNAVTRLYRIDLTTGAAVDVGRLGDGTMNVSGMTLGSAPAGSVRIEQSNYQFSEAANRVTVRVIRSSGDTGPTSVILDSVNGTALLGRDFLGFPAEIRFADGQTVASHSFTIVDNDRFTGNLFARLVLRSPTNGVVLGQNASAVIVIVDNDPPPQSPPPAPPPSREQLLGTRQFAVGTNPGGTAVKLFQPDLPLLLDLPDAFPGFEADGARVAVADVTGNGIADIVIGSGPGQTSLVRVLDGATFTEIFRIVPFEGEFTGGVWVAAGDITGDGKAEIVITPDEGGGPRVRIFRGGDFALIADFFGIDDPNFRGGARAAVGDINRDGRADLVVAAGFGGGPRMAILAGRSVARGELPERLVPDFFAFEEQLRNGAFVAVGDVTGDGHADLVFGGGPGGGPRVRIVDGLSLLNTPGVDSLDNFLELQLADFFAGDPDNRGGVRVTVKDLDGDQFGDVIVGAGDGAGSLVTAYRGADLSRGLIDPLFQFEAFPGFPHGVYVG